MLAIFITWLPVGQQRAELGEIAAHVAVAAHAERHDMRFFVEGEFDHHVLGAAVDGRT